MNCKKPRIFFACYLQSQVIVSNFTFLANDVPWHMTRLLYVVTGEYMRKSGNAAGASYSSLVCCKVKCSRVLTFHHHPLFLLSHFTPFLLSRSEWKIGVGFPWNFNVGMRLSCQRISSRGNLFIHRKSGLIQLKYPCREGDDVSFSWGEGQVRRGQRSSINGERYCVSKWQPVASSIPFRRWG